MPGLQLFTQSAKLDQIGLGSQNIINWYYEEFGEDEAKYVSALLPRDGAVRVCVVGATASETCRGLYYSSSGPASSDFLPRLYGVWGSTVYRSNANITAMLPIGNVGQYGNPCSMTDNGFNFVVVDGYAMFKARLDDIDGSPVYSQVSLPVLPVTGQPAKPTHVGFIWQRLVINSKSSNVFFFSNFTDPTTLTGGEVFEDGNFANAEQSSDPISALRVFNGSLWLFGVRSYEVWNVTTSDIRPFSYVGGSSNAVGIQAPYSVASVGDVGFWLGSSDVGTSQVYMTKGTSVQAVNSSCFDQINKMLSKESAIGYAYSDNGHLFYILSFMASNMTFVYDAKYDKWHNRLMRDVNAGTWKAYPYGFITMANGKIYSGLLSDESALCVFDGDTETEWDGRLILREGVSIPLTDSMDNLNIQRLTLDCETGTTLALSGYQSDPQISLSLSRDGGYTFGNSVSKSLGKQGDYMRMINWTGLGRSRKPVFKLVTTKKCAIYNARIIYTKYGVS